MSTIHAASMSQLIDRLMTAPISLPPMLIENLDIIIFLLQVKISERYVRRANEIHEITGLKNEKPTTEIVFKWKPVDDIFELTGKSKILEHIRKSMGLTEEEINNELHARAKILEWLLNTGVYEYIDVSGIINRYYSDPDKVIELVQQS